MSRNARDIPGYTPSRSSERANLNRLQDFGRRAVMTVSTAQELAKAFKRIGEAGATILIREGTYTLYSGLSSSYNDVHVIGLGKVELTARSGFTGSLLSLTGRRCEVRNIGLYDGNGSNNRMQALSVTGDYVRISGCRFRLCYQAILSTGAGVIIESCIVKNATASDYAIKATGTFTSITGNLVENSHTYDIESTGTNNALTGNCVNTLRYLAASGSVEAGNTGTITST